MPRADPVASPGTFARSHPQRDHHVDDFALRGGILLAAHGVRRPTKDAAANAIHSKVAADVAHDIAAVNVGDRVVF